VQELMGTKAQALYAKNRERSSERTNCRNCYGERDWDTRVGTISRAVPKLCLQASSWVGVNGPRGRGPSGPGGELGGLEDFSC